MRKIITGFNPLEISYHPSKQGKAEVSKGPIWLTYPQDLPKPSVTAYRLTFSLKEKITVTLHVSADERYELWVDGQRLGRGPERSTPAVGLSYFLLSSMSPDFQ